MRQHVQRSIREVHRTFFRRALPSKLSINIEYYTGNQRQLDELLYFLKERGYAFMGPGEFLTAADKSCFLSFDDNYRSWLETLPIFEKYQAHATFYVNSWPFRDRVSTTEVHRYFKNIGFPDAELDQETTLTTSELREIAAAGHTIGAHTRTKSVLTALPQAAAEEEIRLCREELEALLGHPPEHFAYPFGMRRYFCRALRAYCRSIGFTTIANGIPCMQYAPSRPDSLHRSIWFLDQPMAFNLDNVCIDGRLFSYLTGRSAVGGYFR